MYKQCDIVQDLLPLYVDGACSASSAAMITEHLKNCPACKTFYEKLCSVSGEEILKAEMSEVVSRHEKQIKKKRLLTITKSVVITAIVALIVIGLLVWRIWPNSFSGIIPVNKNAIASFSSNVMIHRIVNGQTVTDSYHINSPDLAGNELGDVFEILATSSYRQDFRNLLPWSQDSIAADKNYDGRNAILVFSAGNHTDEWVEINYMSSGVLVVFVGGEDNCRIYHPTNENTFDDLVEYFQAHGVKQ